jgi:L-amino acid N-acyltransferase YncA
MTQQMLARRVGKLARRDVAPLMAVQWALRQVPFAPLQLGILDFLQLDARPAVPARLLRGPGHVRLATALDLDGLAACCNKRATFAARLASAEHAVVAVMDDRIVGYEWFSARPTHTEAIHGYRIDVPEHSVYAYDAYLDPAFRNCGFWLRFKAQLAAVMESLAANRVLTFVERGNTASLRAHLRFGFTPVKSVVVLHVCGLTLFKESTPPCSSTIF